MVNPHVRSADVGSYDFNHNFGDYHLTQATLALAHEQQTANLIAWYSSGKNYIRDDEALRAEIHKRLGLE